MQQSKKCKMKEPKTLSISLDMSLKRSRPDHPLVRATTLTLSWPHYNFWADIPNLIWQRPEIPAIYITHNLIDLIHT